MDRFKIIKWILNNKISNSSYRCCSCLYLDMGKVEQYITEINPLLLNFKDTGKKERLIQYLISNSNLPGRRANLELFNAFVISCESIFSEDMKQLVKLTKYLLTFGEAIAPTNDPTEFLAFCGTGTLGIVNNFLQFGSDILTTLAQDGRWRIREAVAKVLHRLLVDRNFTTLTIFDTWIDNENWLCYRAIAAGFAEPTILIREDILKQAFDYHSKILTTINNSSDSSNSMKTLLKALNYTISLLVVSDPESGIQFVQYWVGKGNRRIHIIIKENLKKNRVQKLQLPEIQSILDKL